jgi:curved DNA-binding protein CbpA
LTDGSGYYAILGVPERASYYEIKRSYRKLARKYHPDRNSSVHAEEMIKKINAAFEVLSDKDSRARYARTDFALSEPEPGGDDDAVVQQYGTEQGNTFADFFDAPHFLEVPRGRFHITVGAFTLHGFWELRSTCSKGLFGEEQEDEPQGAGGRRDMRRL